MRTTRRPITRFWLTQCCLLVVMVTGLAHAEPEDSTAQRAKPCMSCHGNQGRATPDGYYPRIAGKPAGYLLHQLQAFRDGSRINPAMSYLLQGMPDRYLQEFADYFSAQHPPFPSTVSMPVNAEAIAEGQRLVLHGDPQRDIPACADCHGADLAGRGRDIPGLLGVPSTYLVSQLGAWRVGLRHAKAPDCMAQIATRLDDRETNAVISWIASQVPITSQQSTRASSPVALPLACGSVTDGAHP